MLDLPSIAISVRQPWAWAIIHAGKNIENRGPVALRHMGLNKDSRTTLAIHAAQGMTRDEYEDARETMAKIGVTCPAPADLVRGAIIGAVRVEGVVTKSASPWFFGPRGIVMTEPRAVEPIRCAGALGLFRWREARPIDLPPTPRWMAPKSQPMAVAGDPVLFDMPGGRDGR